jgi:hypothetical protein
MGFECLMCKTIKPHSDFYPSAIRKADYKCKDCNRIYQQQWRDKNKEKCRIQVRLRMRKFRESEIQKERERKQAKEYRSRNRDRINAYSREYSSKNRHMKNVHNKVFVKRRIGELISLPCEACGNPNTHAHHDDYNKPFDIRWLCPSHHKQHHKGIDNVQVRR